MPTGPTLTFTLATKGNYGTIRLDNVVVAGGSQAATSLIANPIPPLNEPMVGTPNTGAEPVLTDQTQNDAIPRRSWYGFFLSIFNAVSNQTVPNGTQITLLAPSVDELNLETVVFAENLTANNTAPAVVTASTTATDVKIGDYLVAWNPDKGILTAEIVLITNIQKNSWTLQRQPPGGKPGQSQFGSIASQQIAGYKFYRCVLGLWRFTIAPTDKPNDVIELWPNMCVLAIQATPSGGTPVLMNLLPTTKDASWPAPGFRTLSGAEGILTMAGTLAVGQVADYRVRVPEYISLRNMLGRLNGAAVAANKSLEFSLVYITWDGERAALVSNFRISQSERLTILTDPTDKRFPSSLSQWPISNLPQLVDPFDTDGKLKLPIAVDPLAPPLRLAEDGFFDMIVTVADGSSSDLIMAVQT